MHPVSTRSANDLSETEFRNLQQLAEEVLNVPLGDNMRHVIGNQLYPLLAKYGCADYVALCTFVRYKATKDQVTEVLGMLTPSHTFFFREVSHFDFLSRVQLPERITNSRDYDMRVWCSAASSGEEAYTLAMVLQDFFRDKPVYDVGVLATDISRRSLVKAIAARYPIDRMEHIPKPFRTRYCQAVHQDVWQISPALRSMVTFRQFNLTIGRFPLKRPFDAIFCRNVLIYFDEAAIESVVRKFHQFTKPSGYLYIGAAESLQKYSALWRYVEPGIYQKIGGSP